MELMVNFILQKPSRNHPPPCDLQPDCRKPFRLFRVSKSKFHQKSEKIQKQRKTVKRENNSLTVKQNQGLLVSPEKLQITS